MSQSNSIVIETPVAVSVEPWIVNFEATTSQTITPTKIKAIQFVEITPMNSTAATAMTGTYLSSFVPGAATVTIVSANNAIFLIKVEGAIA